MLSKVVSSSIFKVFGMTRPGIEPRSPGPLANTLLVYITLLSLLYCYYNNYYYYFYIYFNYYYYYYYYYYSLEFFTSAYTDGFHWRLSDSKSPQVSRTLLSILAVFSNAVVWMVSTWLPTSKSSRPFNNPLVTLPKAPITTQNGS